MQLPLRFGDPHDGDRRFWQRRYLDFSVYSRAKVIEKLRYMQANPVKENLVTHPGDWPWSSWSQDYGRDALLAMDPWDAPPLEAAITISGQVRPDSARPTKAVAQGPEHQDQGTPHPFAKPVKRKPPDARLRSPCDFE